MSFESLEKEIRIAKLQIMWTIAVTGLGFFQFLVTERSWFDFILIFAFGAIWFLGATSLRIGVEEEGEKEE